MFQLLSLTPGLALWMLLVTSGPFKEQSLFHKLVLTVFAVWIYLPLSIPRILSSFLLSAYIHTPHARTHTPLPNLLSPEHMVSSLLPNSCPGLFFSPLTHAHLPQPITRNPRWLFQCSLLFTNTL